MKKSNLEPEVEMLWLACWCEPRKAVSMAEVLRSEGVRADCPTFRFRRRIPRRNAVEVLERPLISGLVFVDYGAWPIKPRLIPGEGTASLYPVVVGGRRAIVAESELEMLREASYERTRERQSIASGDVVRIDRGPFSGMTGDVVSVEGARMKIDVGGLEIKISPFLLRKFQA